MHTNALVEAVMVEELSLALGLGLPDLVAIYTYLCLCHSLLNQEEEESLSEPGKEDQKDDAEAASEDDEKQPPPTPSPDQEKAATEDGQQQEEEEGEKADSQVSRQCRRGAWNGGEREVFEDLTRSAFDVGSTALVPKSLLLTECVSPLLPSSHYII